MSVSDWGDISERFIFEDKSLEYFDAPLSGWMRCRSCSARFAFHCLPVIWERLWHWSLIPDETNTGSNLREIFSEGVKDPKASWISIVEDRRLSATSLCRGAWIQGKFPKIDSDLPAPRETT